MAVIHYEYPDSWESKGMNWDCPDTGIVDYLMAIRQALIERYNIVKGAPDSRLFYISPFKVINYDVINSIKTCIRFLASYFVNTEYKYPEEEEIERREIEKESESGNHDDDEEEEEGISSISGFPKMWNYSDLMKSEGCVIPETPGRLCLLSECAPVLIALKNAINKLHVVPCKGTTYVYTSLSGYGYGHSSEEAISLAYDDAKENKDTYKEYKSKFDFGINAASAVAHTRHYESDEGRDEDKRDDYEAVVTGGVYHITKVKRTTPWLSCKLVMKAVLCKPSITAPYTQKCQRSFLNQGISFVEGISEVSTNVSSDGTVSVSIGTIDEFPLCSGCPQSDFKKGEASVIRGSNAGYEGCVYGMLDYGVENGLKFFS